MWYRLNTVVDPGEGPEARPSPVPSLFSQVLDDRPKTSPFPPPPPRPLSEGLDPPMKQC